MKKLLHKINILFLFLGLAAGQVVWADVYQSGPSESGTEVSDELFTPAELDDLLAPIALYPDPLIAQIMPAATFVDQIDEAARFVSQYGKSARIDNQPWDVSVKAVAYYPDVLFMMDQKYDWTVALGQAFVNQQQDVMDAIQRLRAEAQDMGNLSSTSQQQVASADGVISIVPAQPEVIYVPVYDPLVVYVERPSVYGFISFGIGFTIGAWLNRDCDWRGHRVYYHGWRGGGWVSRARPYIQVRNTVYINKNYNVVNINQRVVQHDTVRYREDLRRNVQYRQERVGRPVTPPLGAPPGGKVDNRGSQPRPVITGTRPPERPESKDVYRGRAPKGAQPVPYSGYGGYGSSKDVKIYRERGQSSRENMQQTNRPQPAPARTERPATTPRPGASGARQSAPQQAPLEAHPANRGGGQGRQQR